MIKFLKIRNVKDPERKDGNAGIDFFIPEINTDLINDISYEHQTLFSSINTIISGDKTKYFVVKPHERIAIPGGIKCNIALPDELSKFLNVELKLEDKSSIASKLGLTVCGGIIDPNYKGEIHFVLMNTTDKDIVLKSGQKIIQAVPVVYLNEEIKVAENETEEDFYKNNKYNNRNEKGFGSTGE